MLRGPVSGGAEKIVFWAARRSAARHARWQYEMRHLLPLSRQRFPCGRAAGTLRGDHSFRIEGMLLRGYRSEQPGVLGRSKAVPLSFKVTPHPMNRSRAQACLVERQNNHCIGLRVRSGSALGEPHCLGISKNKLACLRGSVNGVRKK